MLGKLRKPSPKWQSFQGDSEICKLEFQPLHGWVAGVYMCLPFGHRSAKPPGSGIAQRPAGWMQDLRTKFDVMLRGREFSRWLISWIRRMEGYPYAPCMVYLPAFWWFLGPMLVNILYMEHMRYPHGLDTSIYLGKLRWFRWTCGPPYLEGW